MKIILILCIVFTTSFSSFSHEYFFGFAELEYNQEEQIIEGTLILSTHDLEEWFQFKKKAIKELENYVSDERIKLQMANLLFKEFSLNNNESIMKLSLIGYEVLPNGMTNFYFHSNKTERPEKLEIIFGTMMKEYPSQQNKVTYFENEKNYTALFTTNKKQSLIIIE